MSEQLNLPPFESLNDGDEILLRVTVREPRKFYGIHTVSLVATDCDGEVMDITSLWPDEYLAACVGVTRFTPNPLGVQS